MNIPTTVQILVQFYFIKKNTYVLLNTALIFLNVVTVFRVCLVFRRIFLYRDRLSHLPVHVYKELAVDTFYQSI